MQSERDAVILQMLRQHGAIWSLIAQRNLAVRR